MSITWRRTAIAFFLVSVLAGGLFGDRVLALNDETRESIHVYTELLRVVKERYGAEISYRDLVYSSVDGMLRTLDPHSNFLRPDAYSNMRERQQSKFYGLGILVSMRNEQLTVITPIEGTPASRLGIRAGDVISSIEGESTDAMSLNDAVRRLKGPKGTQVRITITRRGRQEPLELTITRDEIPQDSVRYTYMIDDETGYMSISDFNRGAGVEVGEKLRSLKEQGMQRLLIDLRNNGGGLLDQAIAVAEHFLSEELKIVETRGRTRGSSQKYFAAEEEAIEGNMPVVVLVGVGTASAAEILAGAIQDHDIGLIVGTPTWGKGLVQTVYGLSYGSGLALTTAKYYTPSGRLIQRDYTSWFDYTRHAQPDLPGEQTVMVFHTDIGREVFGGGGINPDVVVEPASGSALLDLLASQNALFNFAVEFADRTEISASDWRPDDEIVDQFADWVVDHEVANREELDEQLGASETRVAVLRQLRAEILNATFGLEARHRALAEGDIQVQRALSLFPRAFELLAERNRQLDDTGDLEAPPMRLN